MLGADSDRISAEPDTEPDAELDTQDDSSAGDVGLKTTDADGSDAAASCSHCHRPLPKKGQTVCPHCGYYPVLGICIDLDKDWERLAGDEPQEPDEAPGKSAPKAHLQVWMEMIPGWGWMLLGCNAAIVLLSIFARLAVPSGFARTLWSVSQLLIGVTAFLTCHLLAYLISIADDASMNVLDVVLRPLRVWKDIVRELPRNFRLAAGGSCGVSAAIGSILIIGSLPYDSLLDWGVKAPPKKNLLSAVLAHAKEAEGDAESLEEAVEEFAGTADELIAEDSAEEVVEKNVRVDCVVIGYTVEKNNPNVITSLIIAREFQGTLKFVGRLFEGLTDEVRYELLDDLEEVSRPRAFISVPPQVIARWVEPKFVCRVKCVRETPRGNLVEMEFDEIVGTLKY